MKVETDLVPWIIQQTQKGPPDAWFGKYYGTNPQTNYILTYL